MPKKMTTAPAPATSTTSPTADAPTLTPAALTVLTLLDEHDGTTTVDLVERTGLGRSTVTKALVVLHEAGLAVGQEGGHEGTRRIADRWFAAPGANADAAAPADAEGQAAAEGQADNAEADNADAVPQPPHGAAEVDATTTAPSEALAADVDTVPSEPLPDQQSEATDADVETETDSCAEPDEVEPDGEAEPADDPAVNEAPDDGPAEVERSTSDVTESETGADADEPAADPADEPTGHTVTGGTGSPGVSETGQESDPLSDTADLDPDVTSDGDGAAPAPVAAEDAPSAPRLGKGELRAQVEEHLREHPDRAWTPTAISKVLNRSAGAINNACVKLSESGAVTAFTDKPIRFQWNGGQDADASCRVRHFVSNVRGS